MLSVIIITKNEEDVIGDAVKSAKVIASEILVIDDYSQDETVNIAKKEGAKVIQNKFVDFSSQRNFAISFSKNDWVLYLDSDERLTPEFVNEIGEIIKSSPGEEVGCYFIRRKTFFYGKDWGFTDRVQRLFYKPNFTEWRGVLHETPIVKGKLLEIKSPILHYTHRSLSQMIRKTNNWSEYEANLRLKASHPKMSPLRFIRVMLTGFFDSYIKQKGYKNGTEGLIEGVYQAFSMFITYAKLWEKQNK